MENKKRFYSKEFKEKAVQLSYQRENLKELAGELGINVERLYKWRRASKSTSISPARGKVLKEKVFNELCCNQTIFYRRVPFYMHAKQVFLI